MNKYVKTTLIFAGVWFIAALLNGLLSAAAIVFLEERTTRYGEGVLPLSIVFSFVFSAPVVGLVWFIVVMGHVADIKGYALLQFTLRTALFCAIAAAILFIFTIGNDFMNARIVVGISIIVSALTAVLVFRNQIKTNE